MAKNDRWTVQQLANLANVSPRTLRYYNQIGLLVPRKNSSNGYRTYEQADIDRLQQILFFREMGMELRLIKRILGAPDFNKEATLLVHLELLRAKRKQLDLLILNVNRTLAELKGEYKMTNEQKFEGFKTEIIAENEAKFGCETRQLYGDQAVDDSNARLMGMSQSQWEYQQTLSERVFTLLAEAIRLGDPACQAAQQACAAHREWIGCFWTEGAYTPLAHRNLAEMYVADERFTQFYDGKLGEGAARFFHDAILIYTQS